MSIAKFEITNSFDIPLAEIEKQAAEDERSHLEDVRSQGFKAGFDAGAAEAQSTLAAQTDAALGRIEKALERLHSERKETEDRLRLESIELARSIATKLAGAALKAFPEARPVAIIEECLRVVPENTKISLRIAPEIAEALSEKLLGIKDRAGRSGNVEILPDPDMARHNCLAEWVDSGLQFDLERIETEISRQIQEVLSAPSLATGGPAKGP